MFVNSLHDQLIREYSQNAVKEIAPKELFFFDALYDNRHKTPAKDRMLGSGIDPNVELLSPAIITAVTSLLTYIFKEVIKNVKTKNKQAVKQEISDLFQKKSTAHLPLTTDQLKFMRLTIQKQLEEFGWSKAKARRATNAIIGALALKNAEK